MITNKQTRLTNQRTIVLNEVLNRCDHPTAEVIYESIHEKHPNISKSTVYRNLGILVEEGKISQIKIPHGDRFDLTTKKHYHVYCKECGKVIDADIEHHEDIDVVVSKKTGFAIENHNLVFEGICPECQKRLNKKEIC